MHFDTKNYLKSTHNHTVKHTILYKCWGVLIWTCDSTREPGLGGDAFLSGQVGQIDSFGTGFWKCKEWFGTLFSIERKTETP